MLLQRPDCPLRDTVALWLTHEGGRDLGAEEFGLVLEAIGKLVGTVFVAKDQTGIDAFGHLTEVLRHPLPDRLESLPAAGAGRGVDSNQLARAMVDGDEESESSRHPASAFSPCVRRTISICPLNPSATSTIAVSSC